MGIKRIKGQIPASRVYDTRFVPHAILLPYAQFRSTFLYVNTFTYGVQTILFLQGAMGRKDTTM